MSDPGKPVNGMLSVIVLSNPIPSHPSTDLISQTLESLSKIGLGPGDRVHVMLDGLRFAWRLGQQARDYTNYEIALKNQLGEQANCSVTRRKKWGHISQTLKDALALIDTDYILIVQHDLPFVREIAIHEVLGLMRKFPNLKHIRFNKRRNLAEGSDAIATYDGATKIVDRSGFFRAWLPPEPATGTGTLSLTQTLCWSDNNHLVSRHYLSETILKPIGRHKISPEWVFNPLGTEAHHPILGTYIYGKPGDAAVIAHTDGRVTGRPTPAAAPHKKSSSFVRRLRSHVHFSLLRRRLKLIQKKALRAWLNASEDRGL